MESETIPEKLKEVSSLLKRELKKVRKRLQKQEAELDEASQWEKLSHQADTLLANRDAVSKGMKSVILDDVYTSEMVEIPLNPKCTVDKNAELLYKKARRGKRGFDTCTEKVEESSGIIETLEELHERVKDIQIDGFEGRESVVESLLEDIEKAALSPKQSVQGNREIAKTKIPFRHYTVDGYDIYAGKTSSDNDQLSTRFAKPSDIWFHAVGYAGSHVIIRRPKNEPMPPQKIIDIAGGIAVFFSKAKNTSYAEVHITEARYVRKPRKSKPGLVTAERCKTQKMSPVDPQKLFAESK